MTLWRKLVWWLQRRRREEMLRDELQFHLEEEADERRADGIAAADAAWAARRDLGNMTLLREETRRLWTWTWLEQLGQDLRFALRMMRRAPMFTAMAMLTLALGIGANTAIFSFMDAILLRSLPVHDPASLVVITWRSRPFAFGDRVAMTGVREFVMSGIDGSTYRDESGVSARIFPFPAFARLHDAAAPVMLNLFAHHSASRLNIIANGEADVVRGHYVSGEFFSGLGVTPVAGRAILNDDDRPSAAPVVVLSMGYAQRRFGDPAAAVNRSVRINNLSVTVVGVAPEEFFGVDPNAVADVYLPLHAGEVSPAPDFYWLEMMGRLRPGVDLVQAEAALAPVFQQWVATTAKNDLQKRNLPQLRLASGGGGIDTLRRRYSKPLNVLMAMVGLILAIACANIANLLLARAAARRREMAVRLGIGAGRLRILRQLLTESVCLACISGALGIPIAFASMQLLTTLLANGQQESFTLHPELNWHVLLVTFGLSLVCGIVFGLAPAIQSTRSAVMPVLKNSRIGEPAVHLVLGLVRAPLTKALVVLQIAMSLLLLVAAALFVRTLSNLESVRLGFNPEGVLLFDVNAQQAGHRPGDIASFYADLRERLAAVPGVQNVTMSRTSLVRAGMGLPLAVNGREAIGTRLLNVGPSFLTTMGIPLVEGREIDERDLAGPSAVAVVNELFARTYFGADSPIGRHLTIDRRLERLPPLDITIVGVATMARYGALRSQTPPVVYLSYAHITRPPIAQMTYAVRTTTDPMAAVPIVRELVRKADPELPVTNVRTQAVEISQTINQEIIFARLCSAFAGLALLIACVGLYGTMSYAVAQRTTEIGIRLALGARGAGVSWMFLREVCVLAALGLAISLPIALAASRLVQSFLFDVVPSDPYLLAVAVTTLIGAALVAGVWPARRATRISPMLALRAD